MAGNLFDDVPNVNAQSSSASPTTTGSGGLFDDVPASSPRPNKSGDGASALDIATEPLRGFNKGVAEFVTAPYRALDWAIETASGGKYGLPDAEKTPFWSYYLNPKKPTSTAGRYLQKAGEGVGAAAIPTGAVVGIASKTAQAAAPATTTMGGIVRDTLSAVRAAPAQSTALDAASAASSGVGAQAAEDMGYGPAGQMVGALVGGLTPAGIMAYRTPSNTGIGTATGMSMARRRATEAVADVDAFARQDVRPFGPAFNQGPVASVGKQVTETPYVGAPLRNNLDETMQDAASAVRRVSADIAEGSTPETAGRALQHGLERFSNDRVSQIDPDRLRGLGIEPLAPVQPKSLMSTEAAARLRRAEAVRQAERQSIIQRETANGATPEQAHEIAMREVPDVALARNQLMVARRTVDDLSDAELSTLLKTPETETSFATRREAMYEFAWRQIPRRLRIDARANTDPINPVNTKQAIANIDAQVASNISGQTALRGDLATRFRKPKSHFRLHELRDIRTEVGRLMSEYNPTQVTLSQSQLRQIYGALSRDIEVGIQDLANRAMLATRHSPNRPDYVPPDVAARAARALEHYQAADRYNREGMELIERFQSIMGADNPQAIVGRILNMSSDDMRGNMQMIRSAFAPLRPEDKAEFSSTLVREMGRPVDSARGIVQEVGWSPSRFVTRYSKMSPEARNLFFSGEHQQAIDDLFRIANRLANVDALTNTSRSGTNTINIGGAAAAVGSAATGDFVTPLAIGGSMLSTSVLMSRPAYTNWMVRYMQLRAAVRDGSDRTIAPLLRHVSGLERMAHDNPALWPAYIAVSTEVERMKENKSGAKKDQSGPKSKAAILSLARNSIDRGAKREDIVKRLREMGIDPKDL